MPLPCAGSNGHPALLRKYYRIFVASARGRHCISPPAHIQNISSHHRNGVASARNSCSRGCQAGQGSAKAAGTKEVAGHRNADEGSISNKNVAKHTAADLELLVHVTKRQQRLKGRNTEQEWGTSLAKKHGEMDDEWGRG